MSWIDGLRANPLDWLLEDDASGVRYLALRDLVGLPPDSPELLAAQRDAHAGGPIAAILDEMQPDGYWQTPGPGYNPKYRSTVWSLVLLAQLGASAALDERIRRACAYLLDHALAAGGQFSHSKAPSGTIDCLQGNLCWALSELGVEDPRLDLAFDWMARTVTGDGLAPLADKKAPLRYYAFKCGPLFACGINQGQPCAWGGSKVMLAFGRLPAARRAPRIQAALRLGIDFLFSVDPLTAAYPSGLNGKPSQSWWKLGFPVFYVTDVLQVAEALAGLGLAGDPRLANLRAWLLNKQDDQGRWNLEYDYTGKTLVDFGQKHLPNKWVTLRALRFLKAAANTLL